MRGITELTNNISALQVQQAATHTHKSACARPCTHVHGQYTARDEFTVLSDAEVPRFYPHHVVKHELQVQASFYADLQQVRGIGSAPGVARSSRLKTLTG